MRAVMKMASLPTATVFLLCCSVITSTGSAERCDLYAKINGIITIPLDPKLQPKEIVEWTFNKKKLFYGQVGKPFSGDKDDIDKDGSLKLKNLLKNQTGGYQHTVFDDQRRTQSGRTKTMYLCVQDAVNKPKLVMKCNGGNVQFTCMAQEGVSFQWYQNNKLLDSEKSSSLTKIAEEVKSDKFYCKVLNQVSSETSNEEENTCVKTIIPGLPDNLWGISIWIFIGGGGGIVLVLIVVVIICCIKARRKKRMHLKDEEELRLEWSNPQQQRFQHGPPPPPDQNPPRHPQRRQQPADHVCHAGNAGHTGPRQNRSKQQRPRAPEPHTSQPQPSPRRAAQVPKPDENADEEQPPPLPQPRKKHS